MSPQPQPAAAMTKKKVRKQIEASLNEMLKNLHIETTKKKIQKLVDKFSKKLTGHAMSSLKKQKPKANKLNDKKKKAEKKGVTN
jgi:hypothetical protein